jgi:hypothetical protein
MKKLNLSFLTAFSIFPIVLGFEASSHAAIGSTAAGALVGATFSSNPTQFTFGIEGHHKLMPPFGIGASLTYFNAGTTLPGFNVNYSNSFTTITGQALYFFTDNLDGLRAGAQLGLGISSTDIPGASGSTNFIIGPTAGYDYIIAKQLSIGAEGTVYFTTATNGTTLFQALGALKYWF